MYSEVVRESMRFLIDERDLRKVRDLLLSLAPADIADVISELPDEDKAIVFRILPKQTAADTFEYLDIDKQKSLFSALSHERLQTILNEMEADDRTALLEEFPATAARQLVALLNKEERAKALALLGYPENSVGRLMTPDFVSIREYWTVEVVLSHLREKGKDSDYIHVLYVLDDKGKLLDDVRIRDILLAPLTTQVNSIMKQSFVALNANDDQEVAVEKFKKYDRTALPVIDSDGNMIGIVTVDDVLDVAEEEATEDIQKLGAVEALQDPYLRVPLLELVRKRASWLVILFIGEMLTATAMGFFESEIEKAVVLALFIPLIISSGGNSGSQAATLVIRALAVGDVKLSDWREVMRRELFAGLMLGLILGLIGFLRITLWSSVGDFYGPHWVLIGLSVGFSLVAVVLWGALTGAMLPFVLKRAGVDPATSSAPFVATLVDVTGLALYFTIASWFLKGVLLS